MSYFSRLTDIVTCNLSVLLAEADDPSRALADIISEMREGIAGARRSVAAAAAGAARLADEIDEHRHQLEQWEEKARSELAAGREDQARNCLLRKRDVADLIAGLEQQHQAAVATKEHLCTMHRALEARLAEALRRLEATGHAPDPVDTPAGDFTSPAIFDDPHRQVDEELETLKRQLGLK
jgi:phage shock protein A